mmetsp:Transcript_26701/g.50396  ORF Transcript_26701/g.50396 Transcript_26701/m.50396 type:complete len:247 (+) Transcript_26701:222-962(+)
MDTTCHHHTPHGYRAPEKFPHYDEQGDNDVAHFDEADLFTELQTYAEGDDDTFADDATASETDSCSTHSTDDDASLMSDDISFSSSDEESCCTCYDDEQDLACLAEAASNKDANTKRGVRFSTVEIREYACTIADHPCVRDSCPISLDWRYARRHKRDIDSFENSRFLMRGTYPRKLSMDERRRRIRETSRLSRRSLREMELDIAMKRLDVVPRQSMSDFWGEIDEQQTHSDPEGFWRGGSAIESA